jgi:hypothetical protein
VACYERRVIADRRESGGQWRHRVEQRPRDLRCLRPVSSITPDTSECPGRLSAPQEFGAHAVRQRNLGGKTSAVQPKRMPLQSNLDVVARGNNQGFDPRRSRIPRLSAAKRAVWEASQADGLFRRSLFTLQTRPFLRGRGFEARSRDLRPLARHRARVGQVWSLGSDFRTTLSVVEIHPSARKHGVDDKDIRHAIDHALATEDAGEDPDRGLSSGRTGQGTCLRWWFSSRSRVRRWRST